MEDFPIWHTISNLLNTMLLKPRGGLSLSNKSLIPSERIEKAIYLIRGEKVMLDRDLAKLYDVTTAALLHSIRQCGAIAIASRRTSCFS
jgi:hypothetical protein